LQTARRHQWQTVKGNLPGGFVRLPGGETVKTSTNILLLGPAGEIIDRIATLVEKLEIAEVVVAEIEEMATRLLIAPPTCVIVCAPDSTDEALDTIEQIKNNPYTADIPLLLVGDMAGADRDAAWLSGADEVIHTDRALMELPIRIKCIVDQAKHIENLEQERRFYRCLLSLSSRQAKAEEFSDALEIAAEEVGKLIGLGQTFFAIVHPGDWQRMFFASSEKPAAEPRQNSFLDLQGLADLMAGGESMIVSAEKSRSLFEEAKRMIGVDDSSQLCLFPIVYSGRPLGLTILARYDNEDDFSPRELEFISALSAAVARALGALHASQVERQRSNRADTAFRRTRAELQEKEKYEIFFEHASDGLLILDAGGKVLDANRKFLKFIGYNREEIFNLKYSDFVSPHSIETAQKLFDNFLVGKLIEKFDVTIMRKDGKERLLSCSTRLLPGHEKRFILSGRDVTEEYEVQRELQTTSNFLSNLITSSVDSIVGAEKTGQIIVFNPAAENLFGYSRTEAMDSLDIRDLYEKDIAYGIMKNLRSPEMGGKGFLSQTRIEIITKSGEKVPTLLSASIIYDGKKEIGSVGYFADLRHQEKMARDLEDAQQQLIESTKQAAVVELAGTTAHLLNQPLTTIMGYAQLLMRQKEIAEGQHGRFIESIVDEATRMADIVRRIGRITRYETREYAGSNTILDLQKSSEEEN
jgi:PAS domain S-box-containing protein